MPKIFKPREKEREERRKVAVEKRDNKPFEVSAAMSTLKPLLQEALADSAKKSDALVASWNVLQGQIESNQEMKSSMPDALETMKLRMRLLVAIGGNTMALEEHKQQLENLKGEADVVSAHSSYGEPYADMAKVICWKELEKECSTFQLTGWQQSRDERKNCKL